MLHVILKKHIVSTAPHPTKHIRELVSRPSVSPSLLFVTCSLKTPNTQRDLYFLIPNYTLTFEFLSEGA